MRLKGYTTVPAEELIGGAKYNHDCHHCELIGQIRLQFDNEYVKYCDVYKQCPDFPGEEEQQYLIRFSSDPADCLSGQTLLTLIAKAIALLFINGD